MKAGPRAGDLSSERRRRLTHRALPALGGLAVVSLAAGMVFGSAAPSGEEQTAADFAGAWERGDHQAMYALLDDASRQAHSLREFERAYRDAAATATATAIAAGDPGGEQDGSVDVPIDVRTRVFGTVRRRPRCCR